MGRADKGSQRGGSPHARFVRALSGDGELVMPSGDRSYVENGVASLLAAAGGSLVVPEEVPFDTGIQEFTAWLLAHPEILRMYETRLGLKP